MNVIPSIIQGGSHTDERGTLQFWNEFDMALVKRFYTITHSDIDTLRGWRGHRTEQRWFSVSTGSFLIKLVKIDNWELPSKDLTVLTFTLFAERTQVLHIPMGYASLIKAQVQDSMLLVFADHGIKHAKDDDYLYAADYFNG
ncbi:MAG TPA: hypothetical protein VL088_08935 [Pedobacter sp.]|nr:hypothetical protein [Pedobacter sp.]